MRFIPEAFLLVVPLPHPLFSFFILKVQQNLNLVEKAVELNRQEHRLWSQTVWSPHLNLPEGMVLAFPSRSFPGCHTEARVGCLED